MSLLTPPDSREFKRYSIDWKAAVVFETALGRTIFHGVTHEISRRGATVQLDENLGSVRVVTLFLAVPPARLYQPKLMIEVSGQVCEVIRSETDHSFRVNFEFMSFRGTGQAVLEKILSERESALERYSFRS